MAPEETTLWTVDATLDSFKFEDNPTSGDSDYHLVIRDDAGNTMISEIPFPGCTQGSVWASQIASARAAFDSQFTATSTLTSANGMRVRITGVGMFDKPAHGDGHSANGMEIHPILKIEFNPSGPPPTPTPEVPSVTSPPITPATTAPEPTMTPTPTPVATGGHDLIVNGGFEDGELGWVATPGVITNQTQAHSGFWLAWFGGLGQRHTDTLSQTVDIPSDTASATLSFWLRIDTDEVKSKPFDTLEVQILDGAGNLLKSVVTLSNVEEGPRYQRVHFDVTAFAGQRIQIKFVANEDGARATSFLVDTVRLVVQK